MAAAWALAAATAVMALSWALTPATALAFTTQSYENCATLSVAENINLAWTVNGSQIYMAVWAPAPNGYVAAGFSDSGDMNGGAAGFGEVWMISTSTTSGSVCNPGCVLDGVVHGTDQPSIDNSLPLSLSNIVVTKNSTTIIGEFTRAITSSKSTKDYTISLTSAMTMIWAIQPSNHISSSNSIPSHRYSGSITVSFGGSQPCDGGSSSSGNVYTSPSNDFRLAWAVDTANSAITFDMEAAATGWVSFGVGTTGTMASSDMYVGWVSGGVATVSDAYGTGHTAPQPDTTQGGTNDVTSVSGSTNSTWTHLTFTRLLNTGDSYDTVISNTALYVLWAYCQTVPSSATSYSQHSVYSIVSINFLASGSGSVATVPPTTPAPTVAGTPPVASTLPSYTTPSNVMSIAWSVNGSAITFTVKANVTGWAGLGLNSAGLMAGADMYVGWVSGGVPSVVDASASGHSTPVPDTQNGGTNDATNVSGAQTATSLTFEFTRLLSTGDKDDYTIANAGVYLMWAYSSQVPSSASVYAQHDAYGSTYVNLLSSTPVATPAPTASPAPTTAPTAAAGASGFTSTNGDFKLAWSLSSDLAFITFTMTSTASAGWVAVGFNTAPLMAGADMYVGWIGSSGTAQVYDTYCSGHNQPTLDTQLGGVSNVDQISGSTTGGSTTLTFRRPVTSNDTYDQTIQSSMYIVWAYDGQTGSSSGSSISFPQHGSGYGSIQVNVFSGSVGVQTSGSSLFAPSLILLGIVGAVFVLVGVVRLCCWVVASPDDYVPRKGEPLNYGPDELEMSSSSIAWEYPIGSHGSAEAAAPRRPPAARPPPPVPLRQMANANAAAASSRGPQAVPSSMAMLRAASQLENGSSGSSTRNLLSPSPPAYQPPASVQSSRVAPAASKGFSHGVLTMVNRRLPGTDKSVGHLLVALLFLGCNAIAYFFGSATNMAVKFGSLALANAFLVSLPATRNSVILLFLGVSYEQTIVFHRWLGYLVLCLTTVHAALTWWLWTSGTPRIDIITETFSVTQYTYGFAAWLVVIVMAITALSYFRRNHFNFFYRVHHIFIAFYVLVAFHSPSTQNYIFVTAGLYAVDRVIRLFRDLTTPRTATVANVKGDSSAGGSVLQLRIPKRRWLRWLTPSEPGQFVVLYIPAATAFEAHPFSLTSAPSDDYYEVHMRALGDYTSALVKSQLRRHAEPLTVTVEGPYGAVGLRYSEYSTLAFVAGGIGITPVIGILKDIFRDTRLSGPSTAHYLQHVHVFWSVQTFQQFGWFAEELFDALQVADAFDGRGGRRALPQLHVSVFATKHGASANPYESLQMHTPRAELVFARGRPQLLACVGVAAASAGARGRTFVFACGPKPMVHETWDHTTTLRRLNHDVRFHRETFEL